MDGVAARATVAGSASAEIAIQADVEKVVECQKMVAGERGAALVAPCAAGAAIVRRERKAKRMRLFPGDHDITFARRVGGNDFDVSFRRRKTFEIFQRLFDIAQVEQVARCGGDGIDGVGSRVAVFRKSDAADAARNDSQFERSRAQILRCGENAGSHIAARDDGVLDSGHRLLDAAASQASAGGGIFGNAGCLQRPSKNSCRVDQSDALDVEAGRFAGERAAFSGRRNGNPYVGRADFFFAEHAFAFLLALKFPCRRIVGQGVRRGRQKNAGKERSRQECSTEFPCGRRTLAEKRHGFFIVVASYLYRTMLFLMLF